MKRRFINEREKKSADIFLPAEDLRIEVKSGKYVYGSSVASFGSGKQIAQGKFDFCVFVPYHKYKVKEFLVFSREELTEAAEKPRRRFARFPNNACLLIRCDNLEALKKRLKPFDEEMLRIEFGLHTHPEKFVTRWDKIKSNWTKEDISCLW